MRWTDRVIGIVLGLIAGVAIVAGFVFWGSENTIDAPSLGGGSSQSQSAQHDQTPPIETVQVIGGAPPDAGAPTFDYRKGDQVRLQVESDGTVGLEVVGLGITRTVPGGTPTLIEFKATQPGNFPVIVIASHIGVANVRVGAGPGL